MLPPTHSTQLVGWGYLEEKKKKKPGRQRETGPAKPLLLLENRLSYKKPSEKEKLRIERERKRVFVLEREIEFLCLALTYT